MSFELNENHQPIRRYIYENGKDDVQGYVEYAEVDDPQYFSFERKGWYSYIKDQVGTITKVYKHETKQMIETRTYDVFGNLTNQTGSSTGNLGFQSKYYDTESGLNYYYHRYYYPSIGRFINEDPSRFAGGLNFYNFVFNNPLYLIDPFGLANKKKYKRPEMDRWGNPVDPDPFPSEQTRNKVLKNILISNLSQTFKDFSNPELLCCITKCAIFEVAKELYKEILIDIVVSKFIGIGPISTIITLHLTLQTGEEIMDKIKKCYNLDCAHLRY